MTTDAPENTFYELDAALAQPDRLGALSLRAGGKGAAAES